MRPDPHKVTGGEKAGAWGKRAGRPPKNGKITEAPSQPTEGLQIVTAEPTIEFHFDRQRVAALGDAEKAWFVANHLRGALEIVNSRAALSRRDDRENGIVILDAAGGKQEVNVVSESGLYALICISWNLIFTSSKARAKAFPR